MPTLSRALCDFAEGYFGPLEHQIPRGTSGAAYELRFQDGRSAYLKAHHERAKHLRELQAYQRWAPALVGRTPRLLAVHEGPNALLLEAVAHYPSTTEAELHRQAGAWLRQWHALPARDEDPMPLSEAYERRLQGWSRRAAGVLEPKLITQVADGFAEILPELSVFRRVPCHRDFDPRNWLPGPDGGIVVFDFEHAQGDLWLQDLTRLASDIWAPRPDLEAAFWLGYGRALNQNETRILRSLVAFEAGSTLYWGLAHQDEAFIRKGQRWVQQLGLPI